MDLKQRQKLVVQIEKEKQRGNLFYVYSLCFPDTKHPYYIGKGSNGRVFDHLRIAKKGNNSLLSRYIRKFGFVFVFDSFYREEMDSFVQEIELIRFYGRKDLGLGHLLNRTDGGEGCSGFVFSPEYRMRLSNIQKRIHADPEYRMKLSEVMKESWTDERRKQGSETLIRLYDENPERKIQIGKSVAESWKDPKIRARRCEGAIKALNTEEWKKGQSMRTTSSWADPKVRGRRMDSLLKAVNSPSYKKIQSDGAKDLWKERKSIINRCKDLIKNNSLVIDLPRIHSSLNVLKNFEKKLCELTMTMAQYSSDVICKAL